jgi:hypothetical protein
MRLATAHWGAQTLFAANRLGVFALLGDGPRPADEVASRLGADARATRLLLNACVALGLLEKQHDAYANTSDTGFFLTPDSPGYMGDAIRYSDDLYPLWGRLDEFVHGERASPDADYLGGNPEKTRHFVYGMHNRALAVGRMLVELLDLEGRRQLLDLGGGPGTYSALLASRYPELHATLLDLGPIVELAHEIVASLGAAERVTCVAGDYLRSELPAGNDVVLISGVFHRETEENCRRLIVRAGDSLQPGGLLAISDVFTDPGGTSPPFAPLFGLNMLLTAPDGGVHASQDVETWLSEAGFTRVATLSFPPPMPHRVVSAEKPPR